MTGYIHRANISLICNCGCAVISEKLSRCDVVENDVIPVADVGIHLRA
jgi:hypothetical protein